MVHRHACRQSTHAQKIKFEKKVTYLFYLNIATAWLVSEVELDSHCVQLN